MMAGVPPPRNLGISRELALTVVSVGVLIVIAGVAAGILVRGLDSGTTVVIAPLVVSLGTLLMTLVTALKSTEAADTAAKTNRVATLTASQTAAMHQEVRSHLAEICPRDDCPLKTPASNGDGPGVMM